MKNILDLNRNDIINRVIMTAASGENASVIKWHDLSILFKVPLPEYYDGAFMTITPDFMKQFDLSYDDLINSAKRNMKPYVIPMGDFIPIPSGGADLTIVTNKDKLFGAGMIFINDVFKEISETKQADLYILPSSVHEVLVLPAYEAEDVEFLIDLVKTVNIQEVAPEERLSDNIYYYSRKLNTIIMM